MHSGGEKVDPEFESILIFFEMTAKIPVACSIRGRYYSKSVRDVGEREFLLPFEQALLLKFVDGPALLQFRGSEGELRL